MSDILTTRIKERMEKMGSNPTKLSIQSGLNRVAVRDILVGKSKSPSVETIQKIAASLECSVAYLIGEIDTPIFVKGSSPLELASLVARLEAAVKALEARDDVWTPERIKEAREAKGLTQMQLAELAGLHVITLSKIERGVIKNPSQMPAIIEALQSDNAAPSGNTMTGEALRIARKMHSLTQGDVADFLGVTVQAVSQWEKGKTVPDHDNTIKLQKLFPSVGG